MSTERKPGSRGVIDPFARDKAIPQPRGATAPDPRENVIAKGSTKTVSPRRSFKKKRK